MNAYGSTVHRHNPFRETLWETLHLVSPGITTSSFMSLIIPHAKHSLALCVFGLVFGFAI